MPYLSQPNVAQHSHVTGTMIEVPGGQKPVEELRTGDMVRTKDNGYQPVRWIGSRRVDAADFAADPSLRPIRIAAGALGAARPARDLLVSQQHCVLVDDWRADLLFGEDEVLAPAKALVNDCSITIDRQSGQVTYYHFMFDSHQIVFANGAETESFHPAAGGLEQLDAAKRAELFRLFPQLETDPDAFGPPARATLRNYEVEVLMAA